ncbi:type I-G CRISPR-associated RAMP protein Csb1/Cas7g [Desulfogranum marinum]|uniref:type I-G CRISPR-associated RAMP protein Csb1/Cas7g n=1 Tax=Desulfogranum marinum TaxID=453220 RepID=UPI001965E2B7|nr:type I-U CRISPR-associated RAMP protein Csb1/Cas7u [Desulfogranum marinum]MBM9514720.1 type I-U CRISPR-associated protein Cas7 [Desulfogranum marinum]
MSDVAISIQAKLEPINGSAHIYPATFADIGHNLVGLDKQTGKATAVQIDSVGSFANRIEAELAELEILPQVKTQINGRELSIHELPHRAYDAILRDSTLDGVPWRQSEIGQAVLRSNSLNATALYTYAPLTLLLGGWDSHGGDAGKGTKIARSVSCEIWGYDVQTVKHCTQRIDPLDITSSAEKHSIINGILEEDPKGKKPSELGHGDVPGSEAKGVFVEDIQFNGAISLTRLRRYHFPNANGLINEARDAAARNVLTQLALIGISRTLDKLDLRSGCELYTADRIGVTISSDGTKIPIVLPNSLENLEKAISEAESHDLCFSKTPLSLMAGPALENIAVKGGI